MTKGENSEKLIRKDEFDIEKEIRRTFSYSKGQKILTFSLLGIVILGLGFLIGFIIGYNLDKSSGNQIPNSDFNGGFGQFGSQENFPGNFGSQDGAVSFGQAENS